MKKQPLFLIYSLLIVALVFASGCDKDDDAPAATKPEQFKSSFTDARDGNVYKAVMIGNQAWMAENLRYLPSVVGANTMSETTPHYYVQGYDGTNVAEAKATENYKTYGVLYNWSAAMAGAESSASYPSGVQGVCPTGWHLPGRAEWIELVDYAGGEALAGRNLKEEGNTHWLSSKTVSTNETKFTALPGGAVSSNIFMNLGEYAYFWSTLEGYYPEEAWILSLHYSDDGIFGTNVEKEGGSSVRCVKD